MSTAMIVQIIVLSILLVAILTASIIGLIRVIPEINQICNDLESKNSRDGNHD